MRRVAILVGIGLLFCLARTASPAADDTEQGVQKLSKRSTRLYVRSTPSGARIKLDGQPRRTSDQLITLPAGTKRVTLEVELDGYLPHQQKNIEIRGGWIRRIEVELEKAPATEAATLENEQDQPQPAEIPTEPSEPRRPVKVTPMPLGPVEKALREKTTLDFVEMPLQDVAKLIDEKMSGVNVLIDHKALEDVGLDTTSLVSVSVKDISMRSALNITLSPLELTWTIRHGVLVITTPDEAQNQLTTKIYPVGDLMDDYDTLTEIIATIVRPESWDAIGGPCSIVPDEANAALVISQTDAVHFEIAELLAELRRVVAAKGSDANKAGRSIPVEELIEETLQRSVSVQLLEMPLNDLADYFEILANGQGDKSSASDSDAGDPNPAGPHINVLIDDRALDEVGLDGQTPITIEMSKVPLRVAMDFALRQVELAWMIRDEALWITTPEVAYNQQPTRIYDVSDLKCSRTRLIEMIHATILPDTWDVIGGTGSIGSVTMGGVDMFVVSQQRRVHSKITRLLDNLRQIAAEAPEGKLPVAVVDTHTVRGTPPHGSAHEALNRPISVDYREMPLGDVVEHLRTTAGINVMIDRRALEDIGMDESALITKEIDAKLKTVLRLILRDLDLTWTVRDDVLIITTPEEVQNRMATGLYPVTDLVVRRDGLGRTVKAGGFLVHIITTTIWPESWDTIGGNGSIREFTLGDTPMLIISQQAYGHADIARMLAILRSIARTKDTDVPAKAVLSDDWESPPTEKIRQALAKKVSIDFHEVSLDNVASFVKKQFGIEVQLDTKALDDIGLTRDTEVSMCLKDIELASALELTLDQLDLAYMIKDEVLLITTPEEAQNFLVTGFYPVGDMIPQRDYDTLTEMIESTITTDTWDFVGGSGSIAAASSESLEVLVILQTADVHRKVAALLADLRKRQPTSAEPEADAATDGMVESRVLKEAMIYLLAERSMAGRRLPEDKRTKKDFVAQYMEVFPWERPRIFPVSPAQERLFTAGQFDDASADRRIRERIGELESSNGEMSTLAKDLIENYRAGKLTGARLEAALRLLQRPHLNSIGNLVPQITIDGPPRDQSA